MTLQLGNEHSAKVRLLAISSETFVQFNYSITPKNININLTPKLMVIVCILLSQVANALDLPQTLSM